MKYFVAHKVSGENHADLEKEMELICSSIKKSGNSYYCSFLEDKMRKEKSKKELILNAFSKIDKLDGIIAIVKSDEKSEGMLIEIGYAYAIKKEILLAVKKGIAANYIRALASKIIEFNDNKDLIQKMEKI